MTVEQIRLSPEWLDLREAADAAARDRDLVERLRRHLPVTRTQVIHDLGVRHRGDGPLARAAAAGAGSAGSLHDRDARPAERRRSRPSRPGCGRRFRRRRDEAVRHHPAAAGRSRRRRL